MSSTTALMLCLCLVLTLQHGPLILLLMMPITQCANYIICLGGPSTQRNPRASTLAAVFVPTDIDLGSLPGDYVCSVLNE